MFNVPRLMVSGTSRSSGKTTVCIGLLDALRKRGVVTQPFKKGPDFIDPMWLSASAGRECRNLDFHMMGMENILRSFQTASKGAHLALAEGNQGLFDGLDLDGSDSTAGLATLLHAPVILVVDASRMNRGVAPLLLGYTRFDPELKIAGVILNKVGSPRHESKLLAAIEKYVGAQVIGVIPKMPDEVEMMERHLGLVPVKEDPALPGKIGVIGAVMEKHVNLDMLLEIAATAPALEPVKPCETLPERAPDVKIGVAMDRAFTFYYPENLAALEANGARIVPFSPLSDPALPEVDALYIGGGFPEIFMEQLAANVAMLADVKSKIEAGMPVYGECGGLMYLCRSILWKGKKSAMAGVIPADVEMTRKPVGLGYMTMEPTGACQWFRPEGLVKCHEFHHSRLINIDGDMTYAYKVIRGHGVTGQRDGVVHKNVLASYSHLHHCATPTWARDFVEFARKHRK